MHVSTEQLLTEARTHNGWLDTPVPDATLRELHDLLKWGPTSANCWPLRVLFVRSPEARARLLPLMSPGILAGAVTAFAAGLGLPVIGLTREALLGQPVKTHSPRVKALYGTGSLAEAAALAAAGPGARLCRARVKSADGAATVAIAEGALT